MNLEHVDFSYRGMLLFSSSCSSDGITNLCCSPSKLELSITLRIESDEVAHQRTGVEAMYIHPVQYHQRQQMPNVHRWCCRVYSNIDPDPFLSQQSVQVISFAGRMLERIVLATSDTK